MFVCFKIVHTCGIVDVADIHLSNVIIMKEIYLSLQSSK